MQNSSEILKIYNRHKKIKVLTTQLFGGIY